MRAGVLWLAAGVAAGALATSGSALVVANAVAGDTLPPAGGPPRFVEETSSAGIDHVYGGGFHFFVGGGVAVLDCDGDARPDVYLPGGANRAGLYRNVSPTGAALRFTEVADPAAALTDVTGAYPLDVDSDGETDLAVLRLGENVLLRGTGDCRFERANEAWGLDGGNEWTTAFSAAWEGTAALPTLAFGNYVALTETGGQAGGCSPHRLFRPDGDAYGSGIDLSPGWCTLSILFSDWNRSGRRDLRMANDRHYNREGEEQLWRVATGEPPRPYTREEGWQKLRIWGMGIASHDLTGDGRPEVFLTSMGDNKLQTLVEGSSQPTYEDVALPRGATAHRPYAGDVALPSTAWHAEFQDVNNDGYVDLFVAKGNVDAMPDHATRDPSNLLLGSPAGTFTEAAEAAGIVNYARGRGAALADFNLDGMLDLIEVSRSAPTRIWRSVGWGTASEPQPMGNWLGLRLEQPGRNRDAIGAWVEARAGGRTWQREVTVGGGHAGGQLGWIHLGLGAADRVAVRVQWPDGETGPWVEADANAFVVVERGSAHPVRWDPGGF